VLALDVYCKKDSVSVPFILRFCLLHGVNARPPDRIGTVHQPALLFHTTTKAIGGVEKRTSVTATGDAHIDGIDLASLMRDRRTVSWVKWSRFSLSSKSSAQVGPAIFQASNCASKPSMGRPPRFTHFAVKCFSVVVAAFKLFGHHWQTTFTSPYFAPRIITCWITLTCSASNG
jgi:hypothetical protein